jgi:aspartyl/asparaginyl beta-hydroxylase (cupin superfamily)
VIVRELLDDVHARFGTDGMERVDECVEILGGSRRPHFLHPEQEATRIFFPGISAKPWHDAESFPWTGEVERRWTEVRAELDALRARNVAFYPYEDRYTGDLGWPGWDTWQIYRRGEYTDAARAACPRTIDVLRSGRHGLREGMFASLAPGAHVEPHTGGVNAVLTVHLPLVVPPGCSMRVAGETRGWEEGRVVVFDDSFIHETWNRGTSSRVVLIWDVWHPELTPLEIRAMTYLFPRIESFVTAT